MNCRKCHMQIPDRSAYCLFCGTSQTPKPKGKPRVRGNGEGTVFKRGRTWTAKVTVGAKLMEKDGALKTELIRVTKGGFVRKCDAVDYLPTLKREAAGRAVGWENRAKMTLQQVYDAWLPTHEDTVSHSTMNCYKAAWHYLEPIRNTLFKDIDLDDLQECVDESGKGRRTKENIKALAGLLYKWALPRHQTDMNYAQFIKTGTDAKSTRPAFTRAQIEQIRQHVGVTPHADIVYALIYTGFRPTELFGLTKDDYRDGILYGGIKTEAGKDRAVPVSSKIKPIIDSRASNANPWLFPRDDGAQLTAAYFRDVYFYPVLAAAGIQPLPTTDHPAYYVPYSTRHTFSNLLKGVKGSDVDKAGLMGHTNYNTTKKQYQSAELEALQEIIQEL